MCLPSTSCIRTIRSVQIQAPMCSTVGYSRVLKSLLTKQPRDMNSTNLIVLSDRSQYLLMTFLHGMCAAHATDLKRVVQIRKMRLQHSGMYSISSQPLLLRRCRLSPRDFSKAYAKPATQRACISPRGPKQE